MERLLTNNILPFLNKGAYIKILLFGSKDLSSEENIFSEPHKITL